MTLRKLIFICIQLTWCVACSDSSAFSKEDIESAQSICSQRIKNTREIGADVSTSKSKTGIHIGETVVEEYSKEESKQYQECMKKEREEIKWEKEHEKRGSHQIGTVKGIRIMEMHNESKEKYECDAKIVWHPEHSAWEKQIVTYYNKAKITSETHPAVNYLDKLEIPTNPPLPEVLEKTKYPVAPGTYKTFKCN